MRRTSAGTRYLVLLLTMAVMSASQLTAGEFTVSGRSEYRTLRSELQAVQFLARVTFAYSETDIDDLALRIRQIGHKNALAEWIDEQQSPSLTPASLHEPLVLQLQIDDGWSDPYTRPSGAPSGTNYRDYAWWQRALSAPDQLRQRTAFALMQIAVINSSAGIFGSNAADSSKNAQGVNQPRYTGIVHYYDMLINHAFGNYRSVLGDVAYHPVMGIFLTHKDNVKPSADGLLLPDENFAREILQLLSLGQFRLNLDGEFARDRSGNLIRTYTNDDIKAMARVFTGLQYAAGDGSTSTNLHDPMEIRNSNNHDFNEKVFPNLRLTLPAQSPNAANANAEINAAIDHIYGHPNVAPFICSNLIQHLVKANPSKRYVRDVSAVFNDNGQGMRGDLGAVVRAILLHNEALRSQSYRRIRVSGSGIVGLRVRSKGTEHSKLVEPILRYTQFIKQFNGQPNDSSQGFRLRPDIRDLSQLPYQAPSIFNYFRPDHLPPGYQNHRTSRRIPNRELRSPEAQIYTPVFANRFQNVIYRHLHNDYASNDSYNNITFFGSLSAEESLAASGLAAGDFSELLERLDLMMCHGSLSEASKTAINNALVSSSNTNTSELARLAIFGVFGTPECAIDE
jgi:uncharacterized protein (DUF1800 family)